VARISCGGERRQRTKTARKPKAAPNEGDRRRNGCKNKRNATIRGKKRCSAQNGPNSKLTGKKGGGIPWNLLRGGGAECTNRVVERLYKRCPRVPKRKGKKTPGSIGKNGG